MEAINPIQQTTPVVENKISNFKEMPVSNNTVINNVNIYTDNSNNSDFEDALEDAFIDSVINKSADFMQTIQLPDGFEFTLSPGSGPYGEIITDSAGNQTVKIDVQIPEIDGIIDYEVRLIYNG